MPAALVDPPIRGEWKAVHNPGDHPHALDFVGMLDGARLPYARSALLPHLFWRVPAAEAYGWGRPVLAPVDGVVLRAEDGYPDRESLTLPVDVLRTLAKLRTTMDDIQQFAGNYVVVESPECVSFVAHLQQGSVAVTPGTEVESGQRLGAVGNAGTSLLPHLHFHTMREWSSDVSALADLVIPFRFRTFERWADGRWESVEALAPESGDRLRVTD